MDSSIATDPRFRLLAADLSVTKQEVIGSCFLLWLSCYERRSERFKVDEADVAAERSGFAKALVRRGLAEFVDAETVLVHGVGARIGFLERQQERGARGGKKSGKSRRSAAAKIEANASAVPEANATSTAQAYTPAPSPAPAPTLLTPSSAQTAAQDVLQVFAHYRLKHKRAHPKPKSTSKEWRLIRDRFAEGYSLDDLKLAIDGCHKSRWHQGENDRKKRYDSLDLIMRDSTHVQQFLEIADPGAATGPARSGPKYTPPPEQERFQTDGATLAREIASKLAGGMDIES